MATEPRPGSRTPLPHASGAACPVNVGRAERALRRRAGWIAIGAGVVSGGALLALGAPTPLRLLLAVPFFFGTVGLLQAREGT